MTNLNQLMCLSRMPCTMCCASAWLHCKVLKTPEEAEKLDEQEMEEKLKKFQGMNQEGLEG